jgi:hypothetical protein
VGLPVTLVLVDVLEVVLADELDELVDAVLLLDGGALLDGTVLDGTVLLLDAGGLLLVGVLLRDGVLLADLLAWEPAPLPELGIEPIGATEVRLGVGLAAGCRPVLLDIVACPGSTDGFFVDD